MVEGEARHHEDVALATVEGIGEVGAKAVELPPGVDVGEAPVRTRRGDDVREKFKDGDLQHGQRIEAFLVETLAEAEGLWVEQCTNGARCSLQGGDGLRVTRGEGRMQAVDLAVARIAQRLAVHQPMQLEMQAHRSGRGFAEEVFVGDFDSCLGPFPKEGEQQTGPPIELQVFVEHREQLAAARSHLAVDPLHVADAPFLMAADMAAAKDHQIMAVVRSRSQPGRIEQCPHPPEVEDRTVEDVAEERLLDRLALVGALPEGWQRAAESGRIGQRAHPAEEFHQFHFRLNEELLRGRGKGHGDLLGLGSG